MNKPRDIVRATWEAFCCPEYPMFPLTVKGDIPKGEIQDLLRFVTKC